jgi:deazaflavin-dependent oxidoreductase (nitroreductase family)
VNGYSRLVQRLGHRRWFVALGRLMMPVDRWIQRVARGRWTIVGRHGLPAMLLTTTGRRSGRARTQPLLYAPDGDGYAVMGSNWGQPHHPAWTANLLAHPDATVTIGSATVPVRATLATGVERDRLRRLLLETWPAYVVYERRAAGRELRIFRLTPLG